MIKFNPIIRKQPSGEYKIILEHIDTRTGKRRRKWHTFEGTNDEAKAEVARLKLRLPHLNKKNEELTVSLLLERWLAHVKSQISPRTYERYAEIARNNLLPIIGRQPLRTLRPKIIVSALDEARTSGSGTSNRGLAPQTVRHMYRILNQAMSQAVSWQMVAQNPLDLVPLPQVDRVPITTYSLQDSATLIEALRDTNIYVPMLLALLVGMRRGEICALRWMSVDFDKAKLHITHNVEQMNGSCRLKEVSKGRERTVDLSQFVAEELQRHRKSRTQRLMLCEGSPRLDSHFVCTFGNMRMVPPTRITHEWIKAIRATNLPSFRFHDLRHAHAIHLLSLGAHPGTTSRRMGHSSIAITAELYEHAMLGAQAEALLRLDNALLQPRSEVVDRG